MSKTTPQVSKSNPVSQAKEPIQCVRILYQGECQKLTARGKGALSYELGVDEATGEGYIRISGNASSGAFSNEWLSTKSIRTILSLKKDQSFSSVTLENLFNGRSSNNYGYLAAILIAEKVLTALPGKPAMLTKGTWDTIDFKIKSLKEQSVSLTDHIAIANIQRSGKRAQLVANMRTMKKEKGTPASTKVENELSLQERDRKAAKEAAVPTPARNNEKGLTD